VSALIRAGAHAATSHGTSSSSGAAASPIKTYGPEVLTVAQIETCLRRAMDLDKSAGSLDDLADKVKANSSDIERVQADLQAQRQQVDTRSEASVNAYNGRLAALRARIDRHNANVEQIRSREATHNSLVALYNADCAKTYYRDDMEAVRVRLGIGSAASQ
jgi:DNA repair ATPase RecN